MIITYSQHALQQLTERHLTIKEVEATVRHPNRLMQQTPHRWRAVRLMKKAGKSYCLIVIYDTDGAHCEIVTAFLSSKLQKYL